MSEATLAVVITSFGILAVFVGLFIWGLTTGQFRNVEDAKYTVFEREDFDNERNDTDA